MAYDVIFIGGGPGGYAGAIRAAQLGAKVAVVEKGALGGTCLNRGCIPTKALVSSAHRVDEIKSAVEFGIETGEMKIDFKKMNERKNQVVKRLVDGIGFLFKKHKIDILSGVGALLPPGRIEVAFNDGTREEYLAKYIVLAMGSEPALIESFGYDGEKVITSTEALSLEELPGKMLIIGGGVIGCEFASIFSRVGVEVTVVEALPQILTNVDSEVARRLQSLMKRQGITIKTKAPIAEVIKNGKTITARLENGEEIETEKILISIGRRFNTAGMGLEKAGIKLGIKDEVVVDKYLQTSVEGVYAIGDITNKVQLAHVATAQGLRLVENLFGGEKKPMEYDVIPNCIFTIPEVASVGLTTDEAKKQGIKVKTGKFSFAANGRALAAGDAEGTIKVLADAENDLVLGMHMIGPHVTDLISEGVLAIRNGLTVTQIAETIHAHPTLAEAVMEAAEAVHGKSIHG